MDSKISGWKKVSFCPFHGHVNLFVFVFYILGTLLM